MGISLAEGLAGEPIGGHARERDLRMHGEQAQELRPHVPAGPGDSDANHDAWYRHYRFEYRNFSSNFASALESPCRTAPAWPVGPPPPTVTTTSNCPTVLVTSSGCAMIIRS